MDLILLNPVAHLGQWLFCKVTRAYTLSCKCGLEFTEHSTDAQSSKQDHTASWDPLVDSVRKPTNAYGEIDFLHAENDVLPLVSARLRGFHGLVRVECFIRLLVRRIRGLSVPLYLSNAPS